MSLKEMIPTLLNTWKSQQELLAHNKILFNIYEGDLLTYVLQDLKKQLNEKSFEQIQHRIAPINVLKRLIDKLSKIYAKCPVRELKNGNDKDQALFDFYKESLDIDTTMNLSNEFFNLFKTCALEPFLDEGKPCLRVVPSDRFFVYSTDSTNPLRPTHFVKIMGEVKKGDKTIVLFYGYTNDEFLAFDDSGEIVTEVMNKPEYAQLNGKNPFGKIPFIYINRSKSELTPQKDTDTLCMTKLIPVLLSDLNYAVMFQSFSIIYGINVNNEGLKMAPNTFWNLKSDDSTDKPPQLGTIKPEVDTDKVLNLVKTLLSLWMTTRNIKPGAMGDLTIDNAASGIAKVIDEMDTSEDRSKQIPYFVKAESEFWDLIINHLHPVWIRNSDFERKKESFSSNISVSVRFPIQRPIVDSSKQIDDEDKKMQMGIQSKKGALQELYPDWTEKQIEEKLLEVEQEHKEYALKLSTQNQSIPSQDVVTKGQSNSTQMMNN